MTTVDPASQLAALIRVQVAALRRRADPQRAPGQREGASPSPASGAPDLAAVVARRIRAIGRDDPQRERKAFRAFLETVLLAELGQQLVNDPSFTTMVDHVQRQMESDPALAQAASDAAQLLLKNADAPSGGA